MARAITIQKGDDASIAIVLENPDGSAYDATGSTLTLTVRKNARATPVITKPVSSFTSGGSHATIVLTKMDLTLDVRAWRYELALVDGAGNRKTSGLNIFYVTENDAQSSSVNVIVGDNNIEVALTVTPAIAGSGVPAGGATGQVLTKQSNLDLDDVWANAPVTSVAGRGGMVTLTKADIGLSNVDNTSDANKPVSAATQIALNAKVQIGGDLGGTIANPLVIRRRSIKVVSRLSPLPGDFHCSSYATDTLAINSAIAAAAVLGDGTAVELGDGAFVLAGSTTPTLLGSIIPSNNVDVYGQGELRTKLALTSGAQFSFIDSKSVYSISNPWTNSTWSDMEIDGSNADFDYAGGSKGFDGHGIVNVNILRCYIHDTTASGMGLDYPYNCKIQDNTIVRCGWIGKRVITAASWSVSVITFTTATAHGYTGSAKAAGILTASGSIADGDTVTLGIVVYTFKNTLTGAAYEINIGGSTANALANLKKAVSLTGIGGTDYGTGTLIHQLIVGGTVTGTTLALAAKNFGTGGNALATATTSAGASFGAATLLGGTTGNSIVVGLMQPIGYNGIYNISTVIDATHFTIDASINNTGLLNLGFDPGTATVFGLAGTFNVGCNGVGIASGGLVEESVLVSGNFCWGNKNNNYLIEANAATTGVNASYILSNNWSGFAGQAGYRNTGARNVKLDNSYDYGSRFGAYIDAFPIAKTITGASWSAGVAIFTTSTAHGYTPGRNLAITAMLNTAYNGYYAIISTPTTTTFTVAIAADPGTATFDPNSSTPKATNINSPTAGTQFSDFHSVGAGLYGVLVDQYCDDYLLSDVVIENPGHYGIYAQAGNSSISGKVYGAGRDGVRIVSGGSYWPITDIDLGGLHSYDNGKLITGDGVVISSTASTPINNLTAPGLHAFDDQITPTQRYGILVTSGGSYKNISLAGALAYGNNTQDISIQSTSDTIYVNNNVGLNPLGKVTLGNVSGTVTFDAKKGSYFTATLTGNMTAVFLLSTTGIIVGTKITLVLKQDATGGRTLTLPGNSASRQGGPPTLSTTPNAVDMLSYSWDGSVWQEETRDLATNNYVDTTTAQTIAATKTIYKTGTTSELIINADTGQVEQLRLRKNAADDWVMKSTSGSDLVFLNSNGSVNSMVIRNSSNRVDFANGIYLPEISDMAGTPTGLYIFSDTSGNFKLKLANSHFLSLVTTGITSDRALTLPDATDTLVGRATTDTVTGAKTFNAGKLLDKGSRVFDVRAYGALCDGSTDDTTAIQAALTAAASAGAGQVFIPSTSVVTNLTIDSYVELTGASTGVILQAKTGATGYMLALTTPSTTQRVAVRNITFKPNKTGLGGINFDNTGFGSLTDPLHELENVIVTNSVNDAFHFDNSQREIKVSHCKAYFTTTGYGFYLGAGCTDGRFTNCTVGTSTSHGFEIIGNNNSLVGCKAFWCGYNGSTWGTTQNGFHLNGCAYITMASCSGQQNALHGLSLESSTRCAIVGCEFDTNSAGTSTGVGINTYWSTYCSISGNTGSNNGILSPGAQKYGLQVDGTQTGTVFFGNAITGTSGDFGYVSGSGYMLIGPSIADFSGIPTKLNDVTQFALAGATSGATTITPPAIASGTLTLPSATDTLVGKATVDALSNKDLSSSTNIFPQGASLLDRVRKQPVLFNDFLIASAATSTDPFTATLIASGTINVPTLNSTVAHPGVTRLRSSTTTNSGVLIGTNSAQILLGGGEVCEFVLRLETLALSTFRLGFLDTSTNADATDGVYVEIDSSGVATGKTASNTTRSSTSTTYTMSASTWYRINVTVNSTSLVTFSIYNDSGTLLWSDTLTTNIPTASGRDTGMGLVCTNSGTSVADLVNLDYMALSFSSARTR